MFLSSACFSNRASLGEGNNPTLPTVAGNNWQQITTTGTLWSAREKHASAVFDSKIWVIGGVSTGGAYLNDVWYSD